ncbi:EF-hand calcium-binding domain-containing protein 1-like [Agrilus planipennis]|uniref:EF-hand calcium-binding domain-containing protein 1-like n=1 Tax=Agrilus planipennis TaxID=224129 RepID=A0A7F5RME5_AGRPL|nr:EF-hand calcium-binding domain-containing protein 1-like [Agrilus planipennis]
MSSVGVHLEKTVSMSEEIRFKRKHSKSIAKLSKKYRFSMQEMECIFLMYYKIQKCSAAQIAVTKKQIHELLHCAFDITDESSVDRICVSIFTSIGEHITIEEFVKLLAVFLRAPLEEKQKHCYKCYTTISFDVNISRDVMFNALKNSVISPAADDDSEEAVRDFIEIVQKKMDFDRDGKISYDDFKRNVSQNPLLSQFLGQCLPCRLAVHSFLTTFTKNRGRL